MQKVALITGTSSGIGNALAKLLLSKNYLVFGYSRTNQIENKNFTFTKIDLSNIEEVQKLKFPNIDVASDFLLINNIPGLSATPTKVFFECPTKDCFDKKNIEDMRIVAKVLGTNKNTLVKINNWVAY